MKLIIESIYTRYLFFEKKKIQILFIIIAKYFTKYK